MRILTTLMSALAVCLVAPVSLQAKPVEEKNLLKGKNTIAPDLGYIYLHGPGRQNGMFLKLPSDADVEAYALDWDEAFVKAKRKYEKRIKRYPRKVEIAKKTRKKIPPKPVEPTEENFEIDPIELRNNITFGPQFVFAKDTKSEVKSFSYLSEVEPGTYIYYGPIFFNPNGGYFGTCFCMGSVKFEVKPGMITNIGNFLGAGPDYATVTTQISDIKMTLAAQTLVIPELDYALPETLQAYENEVPDFRASGKVDNHFGVTIDRIPPIEGILAYNRDNVVDIKLEAEKEAARLAAAQEAAESATAAAEAVADTAESVEAETVTDEPDDGTVTPVNNGEIG